AQDRTALVRTAIDLGVNYFDTARLYGEAEALLGAALRGVPRGRFVVATKFFPVDSGGSMHDVPPEAPVISPGQLRRSVDESLAALGLDFVDVLQIHGVRPAWLAPVLDRLGDTLAALRIAGKFRCLGVTETLVADPGRAMVPLAAANPQIDVALVAYHPANPDAAAAALPACARAGLGVVAMAEAARATHHTDAYRFAIAHPAVACVLTGTLSAAHLRDNVAAVALATTSLISPASTASPSAARAAPRFA
ncbi:MAG: aldo/keto reductase, partial [Opitutaceae bacterium]|nr:aldo/keto reductase [Opitutaceae bacterium]